VFKRARDYESGTRVFVNDLEVPLVVEVDEARQLVRRAQPLPGLIKRVALDRQQRVSLFELGGRLTVISHESPLIGTMEPLRFIKSNTPEVGEVTVRYCRVSGRILQVVFPDVEEQEVQVTE
jgi:hypothetical protein